MTNWFSTNTPKQFHGKRMVFSKMDAETAKYPHAKKITEDLHFTSYKKGLKMDHRHECKTIKNMTLD